MKRCKNIKTKSKSISQYPINKTEKIKKILSISANYECFDCGSLNIGFVSINNGIFICKDCAKIHYQFPDKISKIKENNLNLLTDKEILYLYFGGNLNLFNFISFEYPGLQNYDASILYKTQAMDYYRTKLNYLVEMYEKPEKPSELFAYKLIGDNNLGYQTKRNKNFNKDKNRISDYIKSKMIHGKNFSCNFDSNFDINNDVNILDKDNSNYNFETNDFFGEIKNIFVNNSLFNINDNNLNNQIKILTEYNINNRSNAKINSRNDIKATKIPKLNIVKSLKNLNIKRNAIDFKQNINKYIPRMNYSNENSLKKAILNRTPSQKVYLKPRIFAEKYSKSNKKKYEINNSGENGNSIQYITLKINTSLSQINTVRKNKNNSVNNFKIAEIDPEEKYQTCFSQRKPQCITNRKYKNLKNFYEKFCHYGSLSNNLSNINQETDYLNEINLINKNKDNNLTINHIYCNKNNNNNGYPIVVNRKTHNKNKSNISNEKDKNNNGSIDSSLINSHSIYSKHNHIYISKNKKDKKGKNIIKISKKINENKIYVKSTKSKIRFSDSLNTVDETDLNLKAKLDKKEQELVEKHTLENIKSIINETENKKYFYENENCTDIIKIDKNFNNKVIPISIEEKIKSDFLDIIDNLIPKQKKSICVNKISKKDSSKISIRIQYKKKRNKSNKFFGNFSGKSDDCKSVSYIRKNNLEDINGAEKMQAETIINKDNWNINQLGESSLYKDTFLIEFI